MFIIFFIILITIILVVGIIFLNIREHLLRIRKRIEVNNWMNVESMNNECGSDDFVITREMIEKLKLSFENVLNVPFEKFRERDNLMFCIKENEIKQIAQNYFDSLGIGNKIDVDNIDFWDRYVSDICGAIFLYHSKNKETLQ